MATLYNKTVKKPIGVALPADSNQSLLETIAPKDYVYKDARSLNDSTISEVQANSKRRQLHRLSCAASPRLRSLKANRNCASRQSASRNSKTRDSLSATNVVSLKGRAKSRQALSVRVRNRQILTYREQEQLVPRSDMDYDLYHESASPEHPLDDFECLNDYYVANPRNDLFWPQPQSEVRIWTGPSQPSTSSSTSYVNECSSTCAQRVFAPQQQQQQSESFLTHGSGTRCCDSYVANPPELNYFVDNGESSVVQSTGVGSNAHLSQSVTSVSLSDSIDIDLALTESSFDVAELDQYLNAPDDAAGSLSAESAFGSIIREDQYENLVAVQLDHAYDAPSTSSQYDNVDLDPSILNEFFTPKDSASILMGPCSGTDLALPPAYTETFTNLEPFLKEDPSLVSPQQDQLAYPSPCIREVSRTPDSTCSDSKVSTTDSYKGTSEYRVKRDKNNVASQKSRLKRQQKFHMLKEEEVELKRRNAELIAIVGDLERQVKDFKEIMMKAITA